MCEYTYTSLLFSLLQYNSFPIHCAVMGGNLALLKWLIDDRCCPIRYVRSSGRLKGKNAPFPLLTSRGRSMLGIALTDKRVATTYKVDIIRYLVVQKGMSLFEEKDLSMSTALLALTAVLNRLPTDPSSGAQSQVDQGIIASVSAAVNDTDASTNNGTNNQAESQLDGHATVLPPSDTDPREDGTAVNDVSCPRLFDILKMQDLSHNNTAASFEMSFLSVAVHNLFRQPN